MEPIHHHRNLNDPERPPYRTCGTVSINQALLEQYPQFRFNLQEIEDYCQSQKGTDPIARSAPITVQVVVHVVYQTDEQNISDLQVQSQIEVLNRDFGASNPDRANLPEVWRELPLDSGIRFALATHDPEGNETNGITTTKTERDGFDQFDGVKFRDQGGVDAWRTDRYLNIWVCNLLGGLLGYAQFPGGPKETDGVVVLYRAFGTLGTSEIPFNLGRTCTHEVGHYLNLRHIWGDTENCLGSDFVEDTPTQQLPNYGKPSFPKVSCENDPHGDMFMNYMDYVDDDTMVMFTPGQVNRMQATLSGPRATLVH